MVTVLLSISKYLLIVGIISVPAYLFWVVTPLISIAYIIFVVMPIAGFMLKTLMMQAIKNSGKQKKRQKYVKSKMNFDDYQMIKEIYKNEREQLYLQNRDLFRDLMKEGKLSRENILYLRYLVEDCLGEYIHDFDNYTHVKKIKGKDGKEREVERRGFENDCHRLYVMMKSYHLNENDWQKINNYLMTFVDEPDKKIKVAVQN